jgi:hypothetical protein
MGKRKQRNRENRFSKIIMITSKNTYINFFTKINIRNPKEHYWKNKIKEKRKQARNKRITKIFKKLKNP